MNGVYSPSFCFFFLTSDSRLTHLAAFKDSALANSSQAFTVVDLGAAYGWLVGVGKISKKLLKPGLEVALGWEMGAVCWKKKGGEKLSKARNIFHVS